MVLENFSYSQSDFTFVLDFYWLLSIFLFGLIQNEGPYVRG